MAFDQALADRVRRPLLMVRGNMSCFVHGDGLIVRVAANQHDKLLAEPGARLTDITGRPMKGFLFVSASVCDGRGMSKWVKRGVKFAESLPAK